MHSLSKQGNIFPSMTSYKIHSLKDSNKLSFIIEWENEKMVQQKLSNEWYIVLSIEEVQIDTWKIFIFEGKKTDKKFIEGKIQAEDIFTAYEILKKQYSYTLTKLYPSTVTDTNQQDKIFQELTSTFQEKNIVVKTTTDTSNKKLKKTKTAIEDLKKIIGTEEIDNKETILIELKKLEFMNNDSIIQETLTTLLKKLISENRGKKDIFLKLKIISKDLGIYIIPNFFINSLNKLQLVFCLIKDLFYPNNDLKDTPKNTQKTIQESTQKVSIENIQKNKHVHILLQKKYQNITLAQFSDPSTRLWFFYVFFRQKLYLDKIVKSTYRTWFFLQLMLLFVLFWYMVIYVFYGNDNLFVSDLILIVFLSVISLSLVIPSETV